MTFDLVLPCYNESASLTALFERVMSEVHRRGFSSEVFRLILVDNGSSDDSSAVMTRLKHHTDGAYLHVVHVPVNRGYGYGVWQGLRATRAGGVVGWSHADEQCDPADAFRAWDQVRESDDKLLVKGRRSGRTFGQWLFSRGFELTAMLLTGRVLHEINAQPKVFPHRLVAKFDRPPEGFAFDAYVLLRAREEGLSIRSIDVLFPPRKHGSSRWAATFRSKVRTIRGMIHFLAAYRSGG